MRSAKLIIEKALISVFTLIYAAAALIFFGLFGLFVVGVGVLIVAAVVLRVFVGPVLFWGAAADAGGDRIEFRLPATGQIHMSPQLTAYVALGDSFSSGEGVRPFFDDTDDPELGGDDCHRSTEAYSMLLTFDHPMDHRFRACSGARVPDMYAAQKTAGGTSRIGAQLAPGVVGPEVGLITMTIGGNDIGFARALEHCALRIGCLKDEFDDSFDDGVQSHLSFQAWAEKQLPVVVANIGLVISRLRAEAPHARILVIGYPNLFWRSGGTMYQKDCLVHLLAWGPWEEEGLIDLQARFGRMVSEVAAKHSAEFVYTAHHFEGHAPCEPGTRWLDFLPVQHLFSPPVLDPGAMHPNRNGHYMLARIVACHLIVNQPFEYDHEGVTRCVQKGVLDDRPQGF